MVGEPRTEPEIAERGFEKASEGGATWTARSIH
jgi:hypothetical protein